MQHFPTYKTRRYLNVKGPGVIWRRNEARMECFDALASRQYKSGRSVRRAFLTSRSWADVSAQIAPVHGPGAWFMTNESVRLELIQEPVWPYILG